MGMYTEIFVSTRIVNNPDVVAVIKYMLNHEGDDIKLPDHPLFSTPRWAHMLRSNSYYFVPRSISIFDYDHISKSWCFISRSDFKNYDNEIELFFDWLKPYVDDSPETMIGYFRYEESNEPTIVYI
jgi:hypothetical protein